MSMSQLLAEMQKANDNIAGFDSRLRYLEDQTRPRKWASLPGLEDEKYRGESFSLFKACNAIAYGDWRNAEFEKEVFRQTARLRDMSAGNDAAGGYMVPVQAIPELIEMLKAEAVCFQLGATLLDGLTGSPVQIPKLIGGAATYWVGENSTITPSDLATGQLQFSPKKIASLVKLSNSLLRMSVPSAEAIIRADLTRNLALAVDLAALRGTGGTEQPLGIINTPNINTVTWGSGGNGAPLGNSLDLFWDMAYEVEIDNALRGSLGFAFSPAIRRALRKMKVPQWDGDTGGYPLIPAMIWASMTSGQALQDAIGHPFKTTTQIPVDLVAGTAENCTELYFGNWAELIIAQWAGLQLMASQETSDAFAKDQCWIRAIMEVDVGLRHPESFCLCNDLAIA